LKCVGSREERDRVSSQMPEKNKNTKKNTKKNTQNKTKQKTIKKQQKIVKDSNEIKSKTNRRERERERVIAEKEGNESRDLFVFFRVLFIFEHANTSIKFDSQFCVFTPFRLQYNPS